MTDVTSPSRPPRQAAAPVPRTALVAVVVTVVLWASAFVAVRSAGHHLSPGALALGRQVVGTAVLSVFVGVRALRRGARPVLPRGRAAGAVIAWGICWFGLYNLALNAAERHLDAGTTALLVNTAPLLVALLAGLLLGEGFPRRLLVGMAVAFGGVWLIAASTVRGGVDHVGVALGLAAAVLYAGCAVAHKRMLAGTDALTMTWMGCAAGLVALLPFGSALVREAAVAPVSVSWSIVYLGVLPTAVAFLTWGFALGHMPAGRLAATTYVVPALVVVLSWLVLGEVPGAVALLGGAVCLVGVAVATLRPVRGR